MPTAAAPAAGAGTRSERRGRPITQPDPRLPRLGDAARSRIVSVVLWANLVCQMGLILTGGLVRLTGSGLGCSTWPSCEPGQFTPRYTPETGIHPFIEFGNRTLTGVLGVVAILTLVVCWRWMRHRGRGFLLLAAIPLIGTITQALIGMLVVLLHLHPGLVSPHFLISPLLVAASTVLLVRAHDADGPRRATAPRAAIWLYVPLAVVGFGVLVLGTIVTGTGPHSGDSGSITRFLIDPVEISRAHAGAVWLFCLLLVALIVALVRGRGDRAPLRAALTLVGLTALQGIIGYVQYFTGLPTAVVFLHLVGAALFGGGVAWVGAELVTRRPAVSTTAGEDPVADGGALR